jgi:hypothetical protein
LVGVDGSDNDTDGDAFFAVKHSETDAKGSSSTDVEAGPAGDAEGSFEADIASASGSIG